MKEILDESEIVEAIKYWQQRKAHCLVMGMRVGYIDIQFDKEKHEHVAIVSMEEREDMSAPVPDDNSESGVDDFDLDFGSYDDIVEEKTSGGLVANDDGFTPVYDLEL